MNALAAAAAILLAWAAWRILSPSLRILWGERRLLVRAAWLRVFRPCLWREARDRTDVRERR